MNKNYIEALQKMAQSYHARILSYIEHAGEKGRLHEHVTANLLRNIAPKKCAFGTGFIMNSQGDISPQCDIVIFDEQHNRPLLADMDVNVFPIECVYAVVEVKTTLRHDEFRKTLDKICMIRKMAKKGKYYSAMVPVDSGDGKIGFARQKLTSDLPPRSFIVSFGADISIKAQALDRNLVNLCDEEHKHFHGLTIFEKNVFASRRPHQFNPPKFRIELEDGLTHFLSMFLKEMRDYPMGSLDVDRYLGVDEKDA